MKVSIVTLGCRVNQSESSVLEGTLEDNGVTIVDLADNPDICIVNTCSVTQKSDSNSRYMIRKAAKTGANVIVTGCFSELNKSAIQKIPGDIRVVDNRDKALIAGLIIDSNPRAVYNRQGHSRPILKVQDGCNFHCSYCTVPLARGKSQSVALEDILERVRVLTGQGAREVVLTGIHLGTYGSDLPNRLTINDLLKSILDKTDIYRVRLSSIEINEIDNELIDILKEKRVCRSLHIPVQSGSNKILTHMRRNYCSDSFLRKLDTVMTRLGDIALGTDVIAGFPGEGISEFLETLNFINTSPFTYLHVFPFSPRPGTDAFNMKIRPPDSEIRRRVDELMSLGHEIKSNYMQTQLNKVHEIILEDYHEDGTAYGTSSNYLKIGVRLPEFRKGSVAVVRSIRIKNDILEGVPVSNP